MPHPCPSPKERGVVSNKTKKTMEKNCMNCMRVVPIYDGAVRVGQRCPVNDMRVNARMTCEEWRSDDFGRDKIAAY